jgi:serine protease Do
MQIQSKHRWAMALVALTAVSAGSVMVSRGITAGTVNEPVRTEKAEKGVTQASNLSTAFRAISKEVRPSVVTIHTVSTPVKSKRSARGERREMPDEFRGTPFEDLFRDGRLRGMLDDEQQGEQPAQSGLGTGVIIDPSGVILTNRHVVAGHGSVTVQLNDGRTFEASDIKTDERTDLAVLRIKGADDLKAARLGRSDEIEVGDWVLAIGNPFGLSETVTAGIISAKGRGLGLTDREDFLQTDAAINPGNSGGPLINLQGEVIGINTAISSRSGGYQGVGFAIPIDIAKFVSTQLVKNGTVKRAYLGAAIQPVSPDLAKEFHVRANDGALVTKVMPNSPAEKAGLKQGDVIVRIGDQEVNSPGELISAVEQTPIGQSRTVETLRDGKPHELTVTLKEQPKDYGHRVQRSDDESADEDKPTAGVEALGFDVTELTGEAAKRLGLDADKVKGVVISNVEQGSVADRADLSAGEIITDVNGTSVSSVAEFEKAVKSRAPKDGVRLLVESRGGSRYVVLRSTK